MADGFLRENEAEKTQPFFGHKEVPHRFDSWISSQNIDHGQLKNRLGDTVADAFFDCGEMNPMGPCHGTCALGTEYLVRLLPGPAVRAFKVSGSRDGSREGV